MDDRGGVDGGSADTRSTPESQLAQVRRRYVLAFVAAAALAVIGGLIGIGLARRDAGPGESEPVWLVALLVTAVLILAGSAALLTWRRHSRSLPFKRHLEISTPAKTH